MTDTTNVNLQCFERSSSFGYDTLYNVCTGETQVIDWGSFDWLMTAFMVIGIAGILLLLFTTAVGIIQMIWESF